MKETIVLAYVKNNQIAEGIGYYVFVLPDTGDVLKVAREKALGCYRTETNSVSMIDK